MILAATLTAVGLLCVGSSTQLFGYRLCGSIAIPVLAIYTLVDALMLPIFVLSTLLAFIGLWLVKQRTLLYGRDELLVAMAIGSAIPLALLFVLGAFVPDSLRSVVFIGSILPGLAAYNYHQLKPQYRLNDALVATGLYVVLVGVGWALVSPATAASLGGLAPPALFTAGADVAVRKGAIVQQELDPIILGRPVTIALFLVGLVVSERVRSRYGLRIGLVAVPLLAIYAIANRWLVVLYVVMICLSFAFLQLVHRSTLLYGRVLVSVSTSFSLLAAIPLVVSLPITRGLSAYFVALLAGIGAYNVHTASPPKRKLFAPLQVGLFALMLLLARGTGRVLPQGFPQEFGVVQVGVGVVVVLGCLAVVERSVADRPTRDEVFEASILSGGESE